MWRLAATATAVVSAILTAHWLSTPSAHACSAGPDFNPVESSDVVVEGRFTGYEILPDEAERGTYVPVSVTMQVERVRKGAVPVGEIVLYDASSLVPPRGNQADYQWAGSGGACGAFNDDPTGRYGLMGLTERDDGTYGPSLLRAFFIGDAPVGEEYERALDRYAMFAAEAGLPALGAGPGSASDLLPVAMALGAFGALLMGGTAAVRHRRRRS